MPRKLKPSDFGNVTFADPTSTYVPENLEAIAGTTEALEKAYQRNLGDYKKLDLALASNRYLPQDQAIVSSRVDKLKNQLDQVRQSGEFELADLQIQDAAREFALDEVISESVKAKQQRDVNIANIMKDPKYRDQNERLAAIALADAQYQGVQRVDPQTLQPTDDPNGVVVGGYTGYTLGNRVDVPAKVNQIAQGYKADTLLKQGVKFDNKGRIISDSLLTSGVSEDVIKNDIKNTFTHDPEVQASLKQDFELANIQTHPEYFTNGVLNEAGETAQQQYIDDQLTAYTNQVASQFGFTDVRRTTSVTADRAALARKNQKVDSEISLDQTRSTFKATDTFDSNNYRETISDTKKLIKSLEDEKTKGLAANDGSWTDTKAQEYDRLKQQLRQKQELYSLIKSKATKSPKMNELYSDLEYVTGLKKDSKEVQEFFNGNPDPLAKVVTGGKYTYDEWSPSMSNPKDDPDRIKYLRVKGVLDRYNDLANSVVRGKDLGLDSDVIRIKKGDKYPISDRLTESVTNNEASYLIEDESGKEIPLDQFISDGNMRNKYDISVSPLKSQVGGRDAYHISFTPLDKEDNDAEQISRFLYPGKGSNKVEEYISDEMAQMALRGAALKSPDDRSAVDYSINIDTANVDQKYKDVFNMAKRRRANHVFAPGFKAVTSIIETNDYLPTGEYNVRIPVPKIGSQAAGMHDYKLVSSRGADDSFNTLKLINPATGKELNLGTKKLTSVQDVYTALLVNDSKLRKLK